MSRRSSSQIITSVAAAIFLSTSALGQTIHPRFSPDGQSVLFYNRTGDTASVEIVDLLGGNPRVLLADQGYYGNPGYIGDTDSIIIAGALDGMRGSWELYRLEQDGELIALTQTPEREMHPSSDSQGTHIAFVRFIDTGAHLFLLDLTTGLEVQLTEGDGQHFHPKFSSDGEWLYFDRTMDNNTGIYRVRLSDRDIQSVVNLEQTEGRATTPSLSPNGEFLAYSRQDDGGNHLIIRSLASGHDDMVLTNALGIGGSHWSPDGTHLVYHRQFEAGYQIEILDIQSGEIDVLVGTPIGADD